MKMQQLNIDIIVEVRTTSKRLPKKALKKILGKTIIELMIERLKKIKKIRHIILATTKNKSDDIIVKIAKKNKIKYYRGKTFNVLDRVLKTAKQFKTDIIVEITGDNPLVDPEISSEMLQFFLKNIKKYDYVSNDGDVYKEKQNKKICLGFSTKIFKTSLLNKVNKLTQNKVDREHVVNFILRNPSKFRIYDYPLPNYLKNTSYRLTMDYIEDFKLISHIYNYLYPLKKEFGSIDIHYFLKKNQYLLNINKNCKQQVYKY
jgi:spore coat polysaccharide biosynthesis protein SpsF